jgi:hypothetical protein
MAHFIAPNNATPWYKSCTAQALLKGAGTTALDAIGILPEGGTVSAAFSLFHGAAGVSNGIKIQQRVAFAAGGKRGEKRDGKRGTAWTAWFI